MLASFPHIAESKRLAALRSYEVLDTPGEDAFDKAVHVAARLIGTPISLIDAGRQWFKARCGLDVTEIPREFAFCAEAIRNPSGALVVSDARLDPRFARNPLVTDAPHIRFYAGAPLVSPEGAALGTLCVIDRRPRDLGDAHLKTLVWLAGTVMTALELRRARIHIRRLPMTDMLTGLASRPALLCAAENAITRQHRRGGRFVLLQLGLDHFRRINEQHGHMTGDSVLQEVAATLRTTVHETDLVGRFGGDEFAILSVRGQVDAPRMSERIRASVGAAMLVRGWKVTASVGAVTFRVPPANIDTALAAAAAMLHGAKSAGRNRILHRLHG